MVSVSQWGTPQVGQWLKENNFNVYIDLFCNKHKIDGRALLTLTEQDLKEPPIELTVLGDIKRLSIAIKKLQNENRIEVQALGLENGLGTDASNVFAGHRRFPHRMDSETSTISENEINHQYADTRFVRRAPPEYTKLIISYLYMFSVFMVTAFVMVMANDRVPDSKKYPPLPDLVLDNMPYVPWAFEMCEMCACVLSTIVAIMLLFHKHR